MPLDAAEIQKLIPHRPPMLMLDAVVEHDQDRIVCTKKFTGDEFYFQGHYPNYPIVPGVLLCEAAMQAGAVLIALRNEPLDGKVPVAARIDEVKLKRMVRPGDEIRMEITLKEKLSDAYYLDAKTTVDGKLAVRFSFAVTAAAPQ